MRRVAVTFTAEGFHCWPKATPWRRYLAARHRHLFHVRVELPVSHDDREIECHDLRDFCIMAFGSGDFGHQSCEMLAETLAVNVSMRYGAMKNLAVSVMEDGEVGATFVSE